MYKFCALFGGAAVVGLGLSAQAAVYTTGAAGTPTAASSGDGFIVAWNVDYSGRGIENKWEDTKVGQEGGTGFDTHRTIYKMMLPTLGTGESISSVSFSYGYNGSSNLGDGVTPLASVDVVAYTSGTSALVGTDWDDNTSAITVSTNELEFGVTPPGTRTITGAALTQAVAQAYAKGLDHVDLRFQLHGGVAHDSQPYAKIYGFGTSESVEPTSRPALTLTTAVPEPAVLSLVGLSSLAALRRRRRQA